MNMTLFCSPSEINCLKWLLISHKRERLRHHGQPNRPQYHLLTYSLAKTHTKIELESDQASASNYHFTG